MLNSLHSGLISTAFDVWYGWKPYGRHAVRLEQTQWWSWPQIQALQMRKLSALLEHAYAHVPFYRRWFQEAGMIPGDVKSPADLGKLPILAKRDIQDHCNDLLAVGVDRGQLQPNHTGGSTGQPLTFYQDANYRTWGAADLLRNYRMTGYRLGMRWAFLWGSDYDGTVHRGWRGRLKDRVVYNTLWINTFDLSTDTLLQAAQDLVRWQPQILVAYVSSATLLARLARECGIRDIAPLAMQTSAEVLTSDDRRLLGDTFGCQLFDRYGCREVGNIAHECDAHRGLHVLAENNLVELLDRSGRPVAPGEVGRIVVTNLNNFAMPFIRYEVGDMAVAAPSNCTCGRGLPLLESVVGRCSDIISSPSGKLLHGEFFTHLFYKIPGVYQFRVAQETIEDLRIQISPGPDFDPSAACAFLVDAIRKHADPAFRVSFEMCDHLPPASSGKYRFTVSNITTELGKHA